MSEPMHHLEKEGLSKRHQHIAIVLFPEEDEEDEEEDEED